MIPHIGVGGAERQLYELIVHSRPERVAHRVLYYSDVRDTDQIALYRQARIDLTKVRRDKRRPLRSIRELARAIREGRPDIAHCWLSSGIGWGRFAAILAGVRHIVAAYRGMELSRPRVLRAIETLTGRRVVHLANSRACAQAVARQVGVPADRFRIVYNGIDLAPYARPADRTGLLAELAIPPGRKIVVSVGRLTPAKDYPTLLRVAQRCRGALPACFLIAGHGELEAELRDLAGRLGAGDAVRFLGLRHDVPRLLRSADLFLFTSVHEGFPNALLEAMAAGLPIVATDCPPVREAIDDGAQGIVVPRGDVDAIDRAVRSCLADADLSARLGAAARQRAVERFSVDRMVDDTVALYEKLVLSG